VSLLLAVFAVQAGVQYPPPDMLPGQGVQPPPPSGVDLDENGNPIEQQPEDSTKRTKIRLPLESYFFDDSTRMNRFFAWNVSLMRNEIRMMPVDTAIHPVQPHYPFLHGGVGDAYQGNMGGASIPINYVDRPRYRDFSFAQGFDAYNIFPETAMFYNVKVPLTFFSYYMSGQSKRFEEGFYLTQAQNISPSTGFNIDYRSQGTRGYYAWSKGRDKNLSLAFSHTGRNYTLHAGYIYNTANNRENGGVVNDRYITDTIIEIAEAVPVRLTDATNVIKGNTAYLVQSYGIALRRPPVADSLAAESSIAGASSVFVGHSFEYGRWTKVYSDTRKATIYNQLQSLDWEDTEEVEFYDHWYANPAATRDSISETRLSNRAFIQLQPYDRDGVVGLIDAGAGVDVHRYYVLRPEDYLTGRRKGVTTTDSYVDGAINGKFRRYFDWGADALFHPVGGRSGDLDIGARASMSAFVKGRPVTLSGRFGLERRSPDWWAENMFSNHFAWSNSFSKENETRLHVMLNVPSWQLELGAMQSVVTNKIYYDGAAMPVQEGGAVSVTGLYADKDFRMGGWSLRHRALLQWSTQERVIPVPLASAYLSYSYEFEVMGKMPGVLRARIGIDARYNTEYYAPGWMPATAQFYNQTEKKIGGYPVVDAYISAKWKRMRILLKMEHVNENLIEPRNYFTLLHYPLPKRTFKLGFTWAFYD
jgi:hypothetical protein